MEAAAPSGILVVDGDSVAREAIARSLHRAGYADIARAESVAMARHLLGTLGPFSLVVLSVQMPDERGQALLAELAPLAPDTIVVMVTAGQGLLTAIDCLKKGAYDYVLKPVDAEGIRLSMAMALKRRQHELGEIATRREVEELVEKRLGTLEKTRSALLRAVCRLAEFRNPGRHVHVERVARYSQLIAEELARRSAYAPFVNEEFLHGIFEVALLHDIGKLALPDAILFKTGELTPEEVAVVESHTTVGRDICLSVKDELGSEEDAFIEMAAEVTAGHHERWDGDGYPDGLKETAIPLSARIVGLADYYDVWRTPMVYRPEVLPTKRVVALINEQSGKKFDPIIVDAFNRCRSVIAEAEEELSRD